MLDKYLKVCKTSCFSESYIEINNFLVEDCPDQKSRYGDTKEVMNFKLEIDNPYRRCTGGYGRNINVFFLMAEALWIWSGRRDVKFLEIFNSKIKEFSDDGEVFHAPYGWRMREWGEEAEDKTIPMSVQGTGYDQLKGAINELNKNRETRRVAISVWNPLFDLEANFKDHPCNDFLMFKIRDNKLYQFIANRSNDLHWGLPTNVFQFSFIGECMSAILGISYGRQTHYSDSLHYYTGNPIADTLYKNHKNNQDCGEEVFVDLYHLAKEKKIDFNWDGDQSCGMRLNMLDNIIFDMLNNLEKYHDSKLKYILSTDRVETFREFSTYLYVTWSLLRIYILYGKTDKKDEDRIFAIEGILQTCDEVGGYQNVDIIVLALNFFAQRVKDKSKLPSILSKYIGTF